MEAAVMLGYNPSRLIYRALEHFEAEDFRGPKLLLDLGFPGNQPLAYDGWTVVPHINLGTARNWMSAWRILGCPEKLIGVEPDELPSKGWVRAALDVLNASDIGYVSMFQKDLHAKMYMPLHKPEIELVNDVRVVEFKQPVGWPCGAFHRRYLTHGLESSKLYGNLEPMNLKKLNQFGLRAVHMVDFEAIHLKEDPYYETWKTLSGDHKTQETFEKWLQGQKAQAPRD